MRLNGWHRLWIVLSGLWLLPVVALFVPALEDAGQVGLGDVYRKMSSGVVLPLDYLDVLAVAAGHDPLPADTRSEQDRLHAVFLSTKVQEERRSEVWERYFAAEDGNELNSALVRLGLTREARAGVMGNAALHRGAKFKRTVNIEGDPYTMPFDYSVSEAELAQSLEEYLRAKRKVVVSQRFKACWLMVAFAAVPPVALYVVGWMFVWVLRGFRGGVRHEPTT